MPLFRPMLAGKLGASDLDKLRFPMIGSPKLDGIRACIRDGKAMSRSMKPIPNKFVQAQLADNYLDGMDGELIVGDPTAKDVFNKTTSAVMSVDGEPDFRFWIFDTVMDATYQNRLRYVQRVVAMPRCEVLESRFLPNLNALNVYEADVVARGYEGLMLRDREGPYKQGRSTLKEQWLLKLKRWEDHEAQIIGFQEREHNGNSATVDERGFTKRSSHQENKIGTDSLGAFIVVGINGPWSGITFNIGTGFTDAQRQDFWRRRDDLKRVLVTYTHFPIGAIDKPRFPTFKGLRDPRDLSDG